jgi:diphosphomevalonate decarboxylase
MSRATATAHPNIAVIKYWGKRDIPRNLPAVPSLSLTLDSFRTETTVEWGIDAPSDQLVVNDAAVEGSGAERVSRFLDLVVDGAARPRCRVVSDNNFPTAAGLASSSSAFAALALAASAAAGVPRDPTELSVLARQGSGSACRSLWGGWVEWPMGERPDGSDSHGLPLAPRDHWDLRLVVVFIAKGPKPIGSTAGMIRTQTTCPLFPGWVQSAPADVEAGRAAVLARDLAALGEAMERSTNKMHATMIATAPTIRYWRPDTVRALEAVEGLRSRGTACWSTMDAGPNVKVLTTPAGAAAVVETMAELGFETRVLGVGGDARLH